MIATLFLVAAAFAQDTSHLTLSQVVDRALATHPSVAAARARRDHAAAEVGEARSTTRPRLLLDASVNQFQEPMVIAPLHRFDPRNPPLFDRTLVQSALSLNWTVFDFGSRAAGVRAQRALEDAADDAVTSATSDLIAQTANAYLEALTAREVLAAQDQRLTALSAEADRVGQRLAQGKAAQVEQLRVTAALKRAEADRIAGASRLDVAERQVAQLTDLPYTDVHRSTLGGLRLADTAFAADTTARLRASLVDAADRASPQVRELQDRVRAAGAGLTAVRATALPELRLGSAYVDRGRWWADYRAEWQVGLSVSYSLYGGGSQSSAIRKAAADDRAAGEQLRLARMRVDQGVDQALAALHEAHARVAALRSAVEQSAEVARIERLALDVGSGTQTDYLAGEADLLAARASLAEANQAQISARIELARVGGELSRDWLTRVLEVAP